MKEKKQKKQSTLGTCERCGRLVVLTKFTLCYECRQDEKRDVDVALAYLKEHRGATLNVIAGATGVDPAIILKLIQGGRMETSAKRNINNPDIKN
jgi:hypothetical protein